MSASQVASTLPVKLDGVGNQRKRSRSASSSSGSSDTAERWSELEDNDDWLEPERLDDGRVVRSTPRRRAITPEKITSATPLKDTNVGMRLLKLMGWVSGGLGPRGHGRAEPIPLPEQTTMGLGKASLDTRMLSDLLERRPKVLESQKIAKETEDERSAREAKITLQASIAAEKKDILAKFHCDVCNKTYANIAQWEEHLLSYGHNHAKRKRDVAMQSKGARNSAEEMGKRREKEKRREEKELARILQATGGKPPTAVAAPLPGIAVKSTMTTDTTTRPDALPRKGGFFRVGDASRLSQGQAAVPFSRVEPLPPQTCPPPLPANVRPPAPTPAGMVHSAPQFVQAKSIAASFAGSTQSPVARPAGFRLNTQTPELHPLLRTDPTPVVISRTPVRNDLDLRPIPSTRSNAGEVATQRSTPSSTQRGAAKMQFVAAASPHKITSAPVEGAPQAGSMKLAAKSTLGLSAFGSDEIDDDDMQFATVTSLGRPKAIAPQSRPVAGGFRRLA